MIGLIFLPAGGAGEELPEVEIRVVADDLSENVPIVADTDLAATSSVYSVIDVNAQRGEVSTVGDVLAKEAGLQIRTTGTLGSFATVSLRGTASNQLLIYMDGIPLNTARSGNIDLSDIPLDVIDRIEVFRGSSPAKFADSAIGGIINIRTKRGYTQDTFTAGLSIESFGTRRGLFSGFHAFESGDLFYSLTVADTAGDFDFRDDNATPNNKTDDEWARRINNDCRQESADLKCRFYTGEATTVTLSQLFMRKAQGLPGVSSNQSLSARYWRDMSLFNITVDAQKPDHSQNGFFLRLFWKQEVDEFRDLDSEVGLGAQHVQSTVTELGLQGIGEWHHGNWGLIVNGQIGTEDFKPANLLAASFHTFIPEPSERWKNTLTAELQYEFEKGVAAGTLRHITVRNDISSSVGSNNLLDSMLTYHAGLKYFFNDEWTGKFNLGTYYRLPTMGELFGDWGFFLGSPDLDPERGLTLEAACEYIPLNAPGFAGLESIELVLFHTEIRDYIQYLFNAQGVGRPANLGKAEITGLEFSSHHRWAEIWAFDQAFTWQQPRDRTLLSYTNGMILPGRAQLIYSADISVQVNEVRFFADLLVELGIFYDGPNMRKAPDKYLTGFGIEVSLGETGRGTIRVDNIMDERYEDYGGYPLPGRTYALHISTEL